MKPVRDKERKKTILHFLCFLSLNHSINGNTLPARPAKIVMVM